jgi:hypothetical protein
MPSSSYTNTNETCTIKGPSTLGVSVSRTGDRRPKDSGGANHHYKMGNEIMKKKPTSKSFFFQHWNDDYLNDLWKFEKGKRGSENLFPFFLFQISFIYLFYQMQRWAKTNMLRKKRKKMVDLGVRMKIQLQMVEEGWKRKWDNYRFTSRWELHVYSPWARLSPYL